MSALEIAEAGPTTLPLADVRIDPELQCRANGVSKATVKEYAEAMSAGVRFPAIVVFRDKQGTAWLADGFHRHAAAVLIEAGEIAVDVREGSRREAQLFSIGANSAHGLTRTNADRRKAALMLLNDATWGKRSDTWIAKAANVSQPFVSKLRASQTVMSDGVRETADGRVMDTSKIGGRSSLTSEANLERVLQKFTKLLGEVAEANRATFADRVMELLTEGKAT